LPFPDLLRQKISLAGFIAGETIRLAEVMALAWGNFESGVRELETRDEESVVETYAWDIQRNVRDKKTFTVPHIRHTKKGVIKLSDPRDIYEAIANAGARRKRANILALIPGDIRDAAVKQCEATMGQKAEVTPERLKNLIEKFGELEVTQAMIETRIQRKLEAMTPTQLVGPGKIYNSLKDGMSAISDWFSAEPEPNKGTLNVWGASSRSAEPDLPAESRRGGECRTGPRPRTWCCTRRQ
jgi:hypothetical protein